MSLACQALCVDLGGRTVLHTLSAQLHRGVSYALLGPNGSGKSTLLRALSGLLGHRSGTVHWEGRPLGTIPVGERAQRMACLFQSQVVAFDFALGEIVAMGRAVSTPAQVSHALERVGLASFQERRISQCSGGEQQRAHLARALCTQADFLLLDEPSNHLDLGGRARLQRIVGEEVDRGSCVVVSTHDLDLVRVCDQVLLLEGGHLRLQDTPEKVLASPEFRACFSIS